MKTLLLRGVRCFNEEQRIPIRPVTLLVGENSTGKSTVLAMLRAAWDVAFRGVEPDFNEEPFDLGGYATIAHYHGGQAKRVHDFQVGAEVSGRSGSKGTRTVSGTFADRAGQPALVAWESKAPGLLVRIALPEDSPAKITVEHGNAQITEELDVELPHRGRTWFPFHVVSALEGKLLETRREAERSPSRKETAVLRALWSMRLGAVEPRPIAGAPIRSKPKRTYDLRRDAPEPEGSHVPMTLATLHATDHDEFQRIAKSIEHYGRDAGLFSGLDVKPLGKKPGVPFQLSVTVDRHAFNITDVGYGVSQVLPILFDTLAAPVGQTFLMQQPEVHLHPRAQAALGSLLVAQACSRGQRFVVETHSDYLVDRVRMEVRDRRGPKPLRPQDVAILYFERASGKATVHEISIDDQGNLVNAPPGYRRFFLEEERRVLGFA